MKPTHRLAAILGMLAIFGPHMAAAQPASTDASPRTSQQEDGADTSEASRKLPLTTTSTAPDEQDQDPKDDPTTNEPIPPIAEDGNAEQAGEAPSEPALDQELSEEDVRALEQALQADLASTSDAVAATTTAGVTEFANAMNPQISVILDVAAAAFSDDDPLQTGNHDPRRTGFNLQQLEMHIASAVDPFLSFDANLVLSQFGIEVEEAYFTSLALPGNLQLRGGQLYTRFGRINPTHPHQWSFLDQPIVLGKFFGAEGSRGLGAELSWLTPLPWYVELVGAAHDAAGECCARSFFGGNDLGVQGPEDLLYTTGIRQFFELSQDWSLSWGLSAQFGPNPTGNQNRTEIYGTDLYLRWRPLDSSQRTAVSLQAEALLRTRQIPDDRLLDAGGYAQLVWTITPRWETGLRYELATGVDEDYLEDEWFEDRQRTSAQLTFFPSHFSRFRLQASHDAPEFRDDAIWAVMLGAEVLVGAHGAHAY